MRTASGGNLNNIQAAVTVNGDGSDTLNVANANGGPRNGTLTSSSLTGAGLGNGGIIHYNGLSALNITLGSVGLTVASTASGTTTSISIQSAGGRTSVTTLSGATDTINIGSLEPAAGGVLVNIQPIMVVSNPGSVTTMNIDDSGDTMSESGTLTSAALTGLGMGGNGITYSGVATLNISLGSGADTFNILSTSSSITPPSMPSMAAM